MTDIDATKLPEHIRFDSLRIWCEPCADDMEVVRDEHRPLLIRCAKCREPIAYMDAQAGRGEGVGGETIGGIMLAQAVNGYLAGKIGREDLRAAVQFMRAREGRQPVALADSERDARKLLRAIGRVP